MAECYPQGCPPCTEEISFPENPINGQRECFHIGKDPNTGEDILKCWVYDQCVPGWRAEGPSAAPINFKGQLDLTKTEAENGITVKEAGDYYIVNNGSDDVRDSNGNVIKTAQQYLNDEWFSLQHPILEGAFVLWSGTEWVEVPRPCGEEFELSIDDPFFGDGDCKPEVDQPADGPDLIARYKRVNDPADNDPQNDKFILGCDRLTKATTSIYGVGQIATSFGTDKDSYGEGYETDWLTNAALAPIILAIQERLSKLEEVSNDPDVPTETVRVVSEFRNTKVAPGQGGPMDFTWTPKDSANLVKIAIIAAGGSGGANCGPSREGSDEGQPNRAGDDSVYYIKQDITSDQHNNSLTFSVGGPGRGNGYGQSATVASAGGNTTIPLTGVDNLLAPGANGGNPNYWPNNTPVGFDGESTEDFPTIKGGAVCASGPGNADGWAKHGAGGNVIIYEYYPVGWTDPTVRLKF